MDDWKKTSWTLAELDIDPDTYGAIERLKVDSIMATEEARKGRTEEEVAARVRQGLPAELFLVKRAGFRAIPADDTDLSKRYHDLLDDLDRYVEVKAYVRASMMRVNMAIDRIVNPKSGKIWNRSARIIVFDFDPASGRYTFFFDGIIKQNKDIKYRKYVDPTLSL